ncbi:MAG: hypothetical protein KF914_14130 [Rhizobiaceae bacterium]|nr:hypothetical protein [Rhizobiaceae bacterium]
MTSILDEIAVRCEDPAIAALTSDVFDTVLFRSHGSWNDFLLALGAALAEEGLTKPGLNPEKFVHFRKAAEKDAHETARQIGVQAVALEAIYADFPAQYLSAGTDAAKLASFEFAFERRAIFSLPSYRSFFGGLRQRDLKVLFASNSYYSAAQIGELLVAAGVFARGDVPTIYSSCDHGLNKNGGLFAAICKAEDLLPAQILHIGDNPVTDVRAGIEAGVSVIAVGEARMHADYGRPLYKDVRRSDAPFLSPLLTLTTVGAGSRGYEQFGYQFLGPMVLGFVEWLEAMREERQAEKLLFAEREGIFLIEAYDAWMEAAGRGPRTRSKSRTKPSSLLAVSRAALFPLSFRFGSVAERVDLIKRSAAAGLEDIAARPLQKEYAQARDYLKSIVAAGSRIIFVDVGYKGTIQKQLDAFFEGEQLGVDMHGAYLIHRKSGAMRSGVSGYLCENSYPRDLLADTDGGVAVLEQCLMPDSGTVTGYGPDATVERGEVKVPAGQLAEQRLVQKGALAFIKDYAELCRAARRERSGLSAESIAEETMRWLTRPSPRIAGLFRHWVHEVNMGTPHVLPIVSEVALGDFIPTRETVRAVGGWKASLRERIPLVPKTQREVVVTARLLACASRGPFALTPLRSATFERRVLSGNCPAPKGETVTLLVLRECEILDGRPVGIRLAWLPIGDPTEQSDEDAACGAMNQIAFRHESGRLTADAPPEVNPFSMSFTAASKSLRIKVDGAFAVASVRFEIAELPRAAKPAASPAKPVGTPAKPTTAAAKPAPAKPAPAARTSTA